MSIAVEVRGCVEGLLQVYRDREGLSIDPYHQEPLFHPMAEGKYLMALAALKRAGCIGEIRHREWMEASKARLQANAVQSAQGLGFGLNFAYKNAPPDEAYVITTCIVLQGVLENLELLEDMDLFEELPRQCLEWLQSVPRLQMEPGGQPRVPVFSEHNRILVFNVIAYWAATVSRAEEMDLLGAENLQADVLPWLQGQFVPCCGWPYAPGNHRFDLLHQCYILNSLISLCPAKSLEWQALQILSQFQTPEGALDKFDLKTPREALQTAAKSSSVLARFCQEQAIVLHNEPARMWSLGEMLALQAFLAGQGNHPEYWRHSMTRSAMLGLNQYQGRDPSLAADSYGFRQAMHLAHGLACVLERMRNSSQVNTYDCKAPGTSREKGRL